MSHRSSFSLTPLAEQVVRKSRRAVKYARRRLARAFGTSTDTSRVVFIMGAQRSGTRVPLLALERSPGILTFREGAAPYFDGGTLRDPATLDTLFRRCPFPVLVLKPLCESHRATELLERFPAARVVWIFRHYEDTVRSASVKWTSGVLAVSQLVEGRLDPADWRWGGLTADALDTARRLYRPGLSLHHANAIMWYLRNRLVLDLDLFASPRVLVVKYEDLSQAPATHFPRVFEFVGQPFRPAYVRDIHDRSVGRGPLDDVPPDVVAACESIYREIDRRYVSSLRESRAAS